MVLDGKASPRSIPWRRPPQNGDAQQSGGDPVSPDLQIGKPFGGLMRVLCKRETLFRAWRKVRDNGQHSLSAETRAEINHFETEAAKRLDLLLYHLSHHSFEFRAQRGVAQRRPGKLPRPIVIAAIENRIVQRAILDILQDLRPIRDVLSTRTSIGGIKNRGREHAMSLVREAIGNGARYFVRSDIQGFFTKIPRADVLSFIARFIADPQFLDLFERATDTHLVNLRDLGEEASLFPLAEKGVAQGSPLSPLIGNILLRGFDNVMNGRGITCIRYIDDFLLLGPNERAVRKAFFNAQNLLGGMGLQAYRPGSEKAEAGRVEDGFDFLGCTVTPGLIQPSRSARQKIIGEIDSILLEGGRSISLRRPLRFIPRQRYAQTLARIDSVIIGWGHAYAFCDGRQSFDGIDRAINTKLDAFRRRAEVMLSKASATESRRILGVQLLADIPIVPLPNMPENGRADAGVPTAIRST
jgi:RNA-directed DNA polymerase